MNAVDRAKLALWKRSGLRHDRDGYVDGPHLNLLPGITPEMIREDYEQGSGNEWSSKFLAIHSSSALVANTFGPWRTDPSRLALLGMSGFCSLRFEQHLPTGLGGTPPNVDVLLQSPDTAIGIESKLLEPLSLEKPEFTASYSRDRLPLCEDTWWSLLEQVRDWPPSQLRAAQLVKHYLGLLPLAQKGKQCVLLYIYWKPLNAAEIPEYSRHAEELRKFQAAVQSGGSVRFVALDYLELWDTWVKDEHLARHARRLKDRYCVTI